MFIVCIIARGHPWTLRSFPATSWRGIQYTHTGFEMHSHRNSKYTHTAVCAPISPSSPRVLAGASQVQRRWLRSSVANKSTHPKPRAIVLHANKLPASLGRSQCYLDVPPPKPGDPTFPRVAIITHHGDGIGTAEASNGITPSSRTSPQSHLSPLRRSNISMLASSGCVLKPVQSCTESVKSVAPLLCCGREKQLQGTGRPLLRRAAVSECVCGHDSSLCSGVATTARLN